MIKSLFERALHAKTPPKAPAQRSRGDFHAVEIVSDGLTCQAAQELAELRFLSREGPPALPLRSCDSPANCICRYRHHEDRRKDARRYTDNVWVAVAPRPAQLERRKGGDRRRSSLHDR